VEFAVSVSQGGAVTIMRKIVLLSLLTLLVAATALTKSNTTRPAQPDDQVAAGTNFVTLHVIVTDRNRHYVDGLSPDQFEIYDNNVKQQITHFSSDDSPVTIGIVYEVNENDTEQLNGVLNALKQFVSTLESEDDFFFVVFNKRGSVTTGFIPSPAEILNYLQFVSVGDPFSFYDGIYFAAERMRQSANLKKALLVVSDAQDTTSNSSYRNSRNRLRRLNAQIYTINFTRPNTESFGRWFFEDVTRSGGNRSFLLDADTGVGRLVLEKMSQASGGSYFPNAESESELAGICTQITLEFRRQYSFGFYSSATDSNKWHTLRVHLRDTERRVYALSYRDGYAR
jgi:Ca-activated chloride channel homolog